MAFIFGVVMQHRHRGKRLASAAAITVRSVDIEFGVRRSGRRGCAARSITVVFGRGFGPERAEDRGREWNRTPRGDEESISRDRERRVMVEPSPTSALIVVEADLLLQVLEVALNRLAQFCRVDERRNGRIGRQWPA